MTDISPGEESSIAGKVLFFIECCTELAEVLKGAVLWGLEGPPPHWHPTADEAIDVFHVIPELIMLAMGIELEDQLIGRINPDSKTGLHGFTKNGIELCFNFVLAIMILFTILGYFNGWGPPDEGETFGAGQINFRDIYQILKLAEADPDQWSGGGADKYNAKNQVLRDSVQDLEDADKEISDIVQRQAGQVSQGRVELESTMGSLEGLLSLIGGVACYTFTYNPGSALAVFIEKWLFHVVLGAAIVAITVAISFAGVLIDDGYGNADRFERRKNKYEDAHDAVVNMLPGLATAGAGSGTGHFASVPVSPAAPAMFTGPQTLATPRGTAEPGRPFGTSTEHLVSLVAQAKLSGPLAAQIPLLASLTRKPLPAAAKSGAQQAAMPATRSGDADDVTPAAGPWSVPDLLAPVEWVGAAPALEPVGAQRSV